MEISLRKMYLYDHVYQLLYLPDNLCFCKDNAPMNRAPIKVHKGVDNKLNFRAFSPDRTPVNLCGIDVYARIMSPHERIISFEKLCRLGSATGMIYLELDEGDLQNVHAGLYEMVLIATKPFFPGQNCDAFDPIVNQVISKPMYSDLSDNITFTLEITEQAYKVPYPTYEILETQWTPGIQVPVSTPLRRYFYSQAIPAARIMNHKEGIHTLSVHANFLTGNLQLLGSLEPTPTAEPDPARWFTIFPSSMSPDIQFTKWTGTEAFTFQANFMWLKLKFFPDPNYPLYYYPGHPERAVPTHPDHHMGCKGASCLVCHPELIHQGYHLHEPHEHCFDKLCHVCHPEYCEKAYYHLDPCDPTYPNHHHKEHANPCDISYEQLDLCHPDRYNDNYCKPYECPPLYPSVYYPAPYVVQGRDIGLGCCPDYLPRKVLVRT